MREGDAARGAEMSPHSREEGGGTAHGLGSEHQARAARDEHAGDEESKLIEEVLHRDMGLVSLLDEYRRLERSA